MVGLGRAASVARVIHQRALLLRSAVAIRSASSYAEQYAASIEDLDAYWGRMAQKLQWQKPYDTVSNHDLAKGQIRWFEGGQLNVAENCVDRHVANGNGGTTALLFEKDEPGQHEHISYRKLQEEVNRLCNVLTELGVQKGDRVCLYMPMTPYVVYAMLACAKLGAIHNVVFAGFSADALRSRLEVAECKVLITADEGVRGGKATPLRAIAQEALTRLPKGLVRHVLVQERTGRAGLLQPGDIHLQNAMAAADLTMTTPVNNSEDPLFLLFTSGSTGAPKGLEHTSAGYLLQTAVTHQHYFQYKQGDVYACLADVGWITGHSYVVYGPLCNGATSVIFESIPTYPDAGRYWEMVERLGINQLYTAPTALRVLMKEGDDWVNKHDRSSLKVLGSVGEPINPEVWRWYRDVIGEGRSYIADTWWQTELGGITISPSPLETNHKPGYAMRPAFGTQPCLLDAVTGVELEGDGKEGLLAIKGATPAMARTIYGDHERFVATYFKEYPGYYVTGDGAIRDEDGHYRVTGRLDDVINVSGHRMGTAEVEDALLQHPGVAEAAVVGIPHEIKGEGICAYVVLKADYEAHDGITKELRDEVRAHIGPFASPDLIHLSDDLPKTRSGKIMRRLLRKIASKETSDLGDMSTLANPEIVQQLIEEHAQLTK